MEKDERAKALLAYLEVNKSGYAGCLVGGSDAGMLVDRRDYPADFAGVIPVQKNSMLGVPDPLCVACGGLLKEGHACMPPNNPTLTNT